MILVSVLIYECADTWQDIRLVYNRKEGRKDREGKEYLDTLCELLLTHDFAISSRLICELLQ